MNAGKISVLRTIAVFALGGMLAGFMPLPTPGAKKVMSPQGIPQSQIHTLTGTVELLVTQPGDPCGNRLERAIAPGMQVSILNRARQAIATGTIGEGAAIPLQPGFATMSCKFPLQAQNVPELSEYIIQLEGGQEFSYSRQQLDRTNWQVELTLIESSN